jgi:probable rRNA maturation factor
MMTTPSNIDISNEYDYPVDEARLRDAAMQVLQQHDYAEDAELTIVLTNNEQVQGLNAQFRGVNTPTDVLSFPSNLTDEDVPEGEVLYLGDILIAHPYALAQAEQEGHDAMDSISLLVVHGVLHLLGFDHDTPEHRAEMWEAQTEALNVLNISPTLVPVLEAAPHLGDEELSGDEETPDDESEQ